MAGARGRMAGAAAGQRVQRPKGGTTGAPE